MGIFGALTTAVTGLRAQSYALENISGNIANSQTTAFKRVDTTFTDMIADPNNTPNKQLAGSVAASSRSTNTIQGDLQSASVGTFMSITGEADGPPLRLGVAFTDLVTGMNAVQAILAALYTRRSTKQIGRAHV